MVLVVVAGSRMRSSSVATDSTFGLRRCNGLKSKRSCVNSSTLPAATTPAVISTARRRVVSKRSSGASAA